MNKKYHKNGIILFVGIICAGILLFVLFYYFRNIKNNDSDSDTAIACSTSDYSVQLENGTIFRVENRDYLTALTEKVLQTEGYENSSNCMYILTMASISGTDISKIESNFEKLKVAHSKQGYLSPVDIYAIQPEEIQKIINNKKETVTKNKLENAIVDNSFNGKVDEQGE